MDKNRRFVLKAVASSTALTAVLSACGSTSMVNKLFGNQASLNDDWLKADKIRKNIVLPSFPNKVFNIKDFGAINDGDFDCSPAINDAINTCHQAGGGKVLVTKGIYKTGPIHLLSNVNLHIEKNATLSFVTDPNRYLPMVKTRWEGLELMGYSPLIYAHKQQNIAVTGQGVLDGNADEQTWWPWKGAHKESHWDLIPGEDQAPAKAKLEADAENNVPVAEREYGNGAFLRPPFVQPYECQNVLIEGITIKNSPFWLINPVLCQSVTVKGVTMDSHGPNNDGCDPESCDHVLIEDCTFNTGDDCIAIKSGRNGDGRRLATPCQNLVIANCHMKDGHGGIVIGSEISGGVNNVFAENCTMSSPDLDRAIRIKTNSIRGGLIEHIRIRNIDVGVVKNAVVINCFYEEKLGQGKFNPIVRDVRIENLTCEKILQKPLFFRGTSESPIHDIHLTNCHFNQAKEHSSINEVNNLNFTNVSINGKKVLVSDVSSIS
ncbi:MAG: glycoside hydrolase family 28 protein [Colwellia sp.]|nr:glycoside hydrolase family 28 protein [Colwellia sp.]